jgi:hypothetical protein
MTTASLMNIFAFESIYGTKELVFLLNGSRRREKPSRTEIKKTK